MKWIALMIDRNHLFLAKFIWHN